ncbi:hypothetical protein J7J26_01125 [Candidatus Micrarchaeota archaeon]|nr:hypothetical protein [Candidatus Micrarchaeota archaeon]
MGEVYNCSKLGHEDSEWVSRRKGSHIKIRLFKRHSSLVEVFRSLHHNPDDKYMNKRKYSDQEILDWAIRFVDETILKLKKDKRLNPIFWRDNPFGREAWRRWRETLPKGKCGPAPDTVAKRFTSEHLIEYIKTVKPEWVKYLTAKVTPDDCYNLVIMSARELGHIPDICTFSSWANKKGVISYMKIQRIIGKNWKEIRKEVYKRLLDSGEKYPAQSYVSDKEIISNIKRCMQELKVSWLNAKDYDEWVDKQRIFLPKSNALKGRRKWVEWVTLAGGKRVLVKYDYEYIKKCIKEVYEQIGHFPTEAEYSQYRKYKGPNNMPGLWTITNMMKWKKWKEVVVNDIDENIKEGVGVSGEHVLFFSKLSNEKSEQGLWKYIRSVKSYKDVIETFMIFLDLKGFLPSVFEWDKFAEQYHLPDSKKLTMIAAKWWTDILEDADKYADRILRDNPDMFSNIWNKLSDLYFSDRKHIPSYSNLISWLKVHESVQVPSKFMDYLYMKSQKQEVVHAGRGI